MPILGQVGAQQPEALIPPKPAQQGDAEQKPLPISDEREQRGQLGSQRWGVGPVVDFAAGRHRRRPGGRRACRRTFPTSLKAPALRSPGTARPPGVRPVLSGPGSPRRPSATCRNPILRDASAAKLRKLLDMCPSHRGFLPSAASPPRQGRSSPSLSRPPGPSRSAAEGT